MKLIAPDYYPRFACLMGACRHNCCIGWEIDIDEDSLLRYAAVPGDMGRRLRENIAQADGTASFQLTADERCPFLRQDGLCDMIIELGQDSLCHICADHPRFRNHFSDRTEIGLGLCCEAAARLILTNPGPVKMLELENDGANDKPDEEEILLLSLRNRWMSIAQDRTLPFTQRLSALERELSFPLPPFDAAPWAPFLLSLERLDDAWARQLDLLPQYTPAPLPADWDVVFEQFLVYLLYRHLPGALEDGDAEGRLHYALFICRLLMALCGARLAATGRLTLDDILDLCRMYSGEIEYSDENLTAILEALASI